MIPGSNLLERAFKLIAKQTVLYSRYTGRTSNAAGYKKSAYDEPVTLRGSVQPVPRNLYQVNGLEFEKSYVLFYVSYNAQDVARDISGDQFDYGGRKYQCLNKTNWLTQDGWTAPTFVDIGPASTPSDLSIYFGFDQYYQNYDNGVFFAG